MINLFKDEINGLSISSNGETVIYSFEESIDEPILINWLDVDKKLKIILNKNVSLKLLETNACIGKCEYILKENSFLFHNLIALDKGGKSSRIVNVGKNASWKSYSADLSSTDVEMEIHCNLKAEGSVGSFNLSSLAKHLEHKIYDVNFIHESPLSESGMKNYGVCQDEANLKFVGIGHIKKGAKQTCAKQSAKIMIFDVKCKAASSPILKIDENDTIASHAASVGKINDEHLFYLMSRGIKEEDAKRLITLGYLNPVLPFFFDEKTRKELELSILERV